MLKFKSHELNSPTLFQPKIKKKGNYSFTFKGEHWRVKTDLKAGEILIINRNLLM